MAGVREADLLKLTAWRRQLFITVALGLSLLIGSSLGLGLLILLWLFNAGIVTEVVKWLTVGGFTAAIGVLKLAVPWVSSHRPKLSP
jgi:hypothetical protein